MDDSLENYLYLNVKMLAGMGISVGLDGKKYTPTSGSLMKLSITTTITLIFASVDMIYQMILMFSLMASDKKTAIHISTDIFSVFSCYVKGFRLSTRTNDLQNIFNDLLKIWNMSRPTALSRKKITRKAEKTLFFVKGYIFMTIVLILSLGIPPIEHMMFQYFNRQSLNYTYDYSVRILTLDYPFNINKNSAFYPVMFKEYWLLFGLTLFWVCGDTLFASLITHLSLQFEILETDVKAYMDDEIDDRRLKDNLIIFVNRHREIWRMCREVENIFSPITFVNVLVSSMNICVSMYLLQEAAVISAYSDVAFHFFIIVNTFLQIIVYCVFAETLTQRSSKISKSIYDSAWADKNEDYKKCIQILIMNTQHPFHFTAYGFFVMTHEQFTKIVKTAVSYYMMLRTTA